MKRIILIPIISIFFITGCRESQPSIIKKNLPTIAWQKIVQKNLAVQFDDLGETLEECANESIDSIKTYHRNQREEFYDELGYSGLNLYNFIVGDQDERAIKAVVDRNNKVVHLLCYYWDKAINELSETAPFEVQDVIFFDGETVFNKLVGSPTKTGPIDSLYAKEVIQILSNNAVFASPIPVIKKKTYDKQTQAWKVSFKNTPVVARVHFTKDGKEGWEMSYEFDNLD